MGVARSCWSDQHRLFGEEEAMLTRQISVARLYQRCICAIEPDELVMVASLNDTAALQNDDLVGTADGREPMRDRDRGPAYGQRCESGFHGAFCARIQCACRLIKKKDGRIAQDRACKCQALLLTA